MPVICTFQGPQSDLIKIVWHDGNRHVALRQRLERGRFHLAVAGRRDRRDQRAQLAYMLDGIDWRNPVRSAPEVRG